MRVDSYCFDPPAGWESQTNVLLREPAGAERGFRSNIQVGSRLKHPGLSLEVVGMTQAKTLERDLATARILHQGLERPGGREAYRLVYEFEIDGRRLVQAQLFCAVADRLISLTGTATADRAEDLNAKMAEVLASVADADPDRCC